VSGGASVAVYVAQAAYHWWNNTEAAGSWAWLLESIRQLLIGGDTTDRQMVDYLARNGLGQYDIQARSASATRADFSARVSPGHSLPALRSVFSCGLVIP
jgi:hypothetical protein